MHHAIPVISPFARFHRDLEKLEPVQETLPPLALPRFEALLRQHAPAHGVEMIDRRSVPAAAG
jgi:hypothetical protein